MYSYRGQQSAHARPLWASDRSAARPGVALPHAPEHKYPRAGQRWAWHWVFPSGRLYVDPRTGIERRHRLYEQRLSPQLKQSCASASIAKHVAAHTLRRSLATDLLQPGTGIRTVRELPSHSDIGTTMICTHVLKVAAGGAARPLDALEPATHVAREGLGAADHCAKAACA